MDILKQLQIELGIKASQVENTVKLLDEDENGRLRLSIRQALPPEPPRQSKAEFEDTLSRFLKQSEERQLDVKRNIRKKSGGKGRR